MTLVEISLFIVSLKRNIAQFAIYSKLRREEKQNKQTISVLYLQHISIKIKMWFQDNTQIKFLKYSKCKTISTLSKLFKTLRNFQTVLPEVSTPKQFTINEGSLKVQGFTKPLHISDMEIISFAISKVLRSTNPWIGEIWRSFDAHLHRWISSSRSRYQDESV